MINNKNISINGNKTTETTITVNDENVISKKLLATKRNIKNMAGTTAETITKIKVIKFNLVAYFLIK